MDDIVSPINDLFLKAFKAQSLIIDCPSITVSRLDAIQPQVFKGRGMLSLSEEFHLRMYVDDDSVEQHDPFDELRRTMKLVPGKVIPDENYFKLAAIDLSGFEWTCEKISIEICGNGHGVVITGRLRDVLRHRKSGFNEAACSLISMFFFDDLRVPLNEYVVTETTLGTQTLSTKICPKFARFEAENFHFEVQNTEPEKGSTVVRVSSSANDLPEGIETRIEESLRYVTLAPVRWCIFEKKVKDTLEVAIVPMSEKQTLFFSEPLDHRRPDCANDFWRLFVAYFQHVVNHSEPKCYHPLSAQLFHVISGEARQLTLVGLLVSVAVEGVLNCEYADLAKPSDTFKASLSQVDTLIQRLKCADATLSARLRGALSPMKSSSTSDKLKALEANGIVTKDMVKTWKKLRNTTAHAAVRPDPKALQGMFEQCNVVYTMLNRMIFYAIGYSGNYQDFATPGWPIGKFLVPPAPVV